MSIEGKIKNNLIEGKWTKKYHQNGQREVEIFKNGVFIKGSTVYTYGAPTTYTESKILVDLLGTYYFDLLETNLNKPKPSFKITYHEFGPTQGPFNSRGTYKVDTEELGNDLVLRKEYYNDSTLSFIGEYKNRSYLKQHGEFSYFDEDSNLTVQGFYQNDRPYGIWKYYDPTGELNDSTDYSAFSSANCKMKERETLNEGESNDETYFIVDEMPTFMGRPKDNFRGYIQRNLNYPASAAKMGKSGRVFVQFLVNKYGCVEQIKVVGGADPSLDLEALRVVASSPQWKPGIQDGEPVNVQFTFPIVFVLQ